MTERYSSTADGERYVLRDSATPAEAHVVAASGNNVVRFRTAPAAGERPIDVLLPPEGDRGLGPSGYGAGNPILFPFPNRVAGGRFALEGNEYQLDVNETARGNHIHGLVSSRAWHVDGAAASDEAGAWHTASLQLDADPDIRRQYPFPCRITVTTRLHEGALAQETVVQNSGTSALPMGYGTHPWFPATLNGAREATQVRVPARRYWQLEDLLPTGETIDVATDPERYDLRHWRALDGNEYDHVFTDVVRRADGWSEAGIRYPDAAIELIVEAGPPFREWVIYAPLSRPVICLEPYTGTTNAVNLQRGGIDAGLVVLQPGESWTGAIRTLLRRY